MSRVASGLARVNRGGSWYRGPPYTRVDSRGGAFPGSREDYFGLRLVRRLP